MYIAHTYRNRLSSGLVRRPWLRWF